MMRWGRKTPYDRRIIAKAQITEVGENPRFLITNMEQDAEVVYTFYTGRAQCENHIKEIKNALFGDRMSCHTFAANQFRLLAATCVRHADSRVRARARASDPRGRKAAAVHGALSAQSQFGSPENRHFFIGQLEVVECEWVQPGETRDLAIAFLNVVGIDQHLAGKVWRIQEGSQLVATAEILSLLPGVRPLDSSDHVT